MKNKELIFGWEVSEEETSLPWEKAIKAEKQFFVFPKDCVSLEFFLGDHILEGCCDTSLDLAEDETANAMVFRIDGQNYLAVESRDDDYRSMLRDVYKVGEDFPLENKFEACHVVGRWKESNGTEKWGGWTDVIELVDAKTGEVVIELGTESWDEFYPVCRMSFYPQAMWINRKRLIQDAEDVLFG